jgi:hypothetical protein
MKTIAAFAPLTARSPEKGAQTSVSLGSSPEAHEANEKYFSDPMRIQTVLQSADVSAAKNLAEASTEMVHLKDSSLEKACYDWEWEVDYLLFLSLFLKEDADEGER